MPQFNIPAIENACNAIRRQFEEEFPACRIFFIVYSEGKLSRIIETKTPFLLEHAAGEKACAEITPEIIKEVESQGHGLLADVMVKEKKLWGLSTHESRMAVIAVAADHLKDEEDARLVACAHIYFVLTGAEKTPWHLMLADAFTAIVFELQGRKGYIKALARQRCREAFEARPLWRPQEYPYPLVMEAAQFVRDEIMQTGGAGNRVYGAALEKVQEIARTYDESVAQQWQSFCRPAQEMAWCGADAKTILSLASSTSEDPYARTVSYLVSDILHITMTPPSDRVYYNPFTEAEANQRHHKKSCMEKIHSFESFSDPISLRLEIKRQIDVLMDGQIIGWCAPAFAHALSMEGAGVDQRRDAALAFSELFTGDVLKSLMEFVTGIRMMGQLTMTADELSAAMATHPVLGFCAQPLRRILL